MGSAVTEDLNAVGSHWLTGFAAGLSTNSGEAVAQSFLPDGWLRDFCFLTWDTRALSGRASIASYVADGLAQPILGGPPSDFKLDLRPFLAPTLLEPASGTHGAIQIAFTFTTLRGSCRGSARLLKDEDDGEWRALCAFTMLDALKGHEEAEPELGVYNGQRMPWEDLKAQRKAKVEEDPIVIIIGAGQTGLQIAARFKQLGLRTLVFEKHARVGDQWRERYRTLSTNTPKQQHARMLGWPEPYPTNWPTYTPKEKLADWMEHYAHSQDLVIWCSSYILDNPRPVYDMASCRWTLTVSHAGSPVVLRPAHIVVATGTLGPARMPVIPGADLFHGGILHASQFRSGAPYAGKRVLVVGAANTAADVAQDLHHSGAAEVTILQRSSTCFVSSAFMRAHFAREYPNGMPTEERDFRAAGFPSGLLERVVRRAVESGKGPKDSEQDAKMKQGLREKGFHMNDGWEGLGAWFLVLNRFGGHWIDMGCAQLIVDDKIAFKSGCEIQTFVEPGVVFTDGSRLNVDTVIFATGYDTARQTVRNMFGADVVDGTSEVWGLDAEGELRGVYRPTGHPGLWYTGGDFFHSRWGSKQLGLLIQANQLGYR